MTLRHVKLRHMIITALFAAIISILAQVAVPLPVGVPLTGQTFAIGLAATTLGSAHGTRAVLLYLALGAVGLPVFSMLTGGLGVLLGPNGGFLVGFLPATLLTGVYLERTRFSLGHALIANVLGMVVTLLCGTLWLKVALNVSWAAAFLIGFTPFIIGGLIKAWLAATVGIVIRARLKEARLLPASLL